LYGQSSVPAGFSSGSQSVKGGTYHTCGIKSDGELACWGAEAYRFYCSTCSQSSIYDYDFGQTTVPTGKFTTNTKMISANANSTCAIDQND